MTRDRAEPPREPPPSAAWVRLPERRAQLLDLAAELVRDGGVEAVTMESLASAAGVNKTVVYRAYPNAGSVLVALFERQLALLASEIGHLLAEAGSLRAALPAVVHRWFDVVERTDDVLTAVLDGPTTDPALVRRRAEWHRQAAASWAATAALDTGAPLADATDAVAIVLAGLRGAVTRWRVEGQPRARVEARFVRVAAAVLDDLGPDPAAGEPGTETRSAAASSTREAPDDASTRGGRVPARMATRTASRRGPANGTNAARRATRRVPTDNGRAPATTPSPSPTRRRTSPSPRRTEP